jgi:hypothetical protein
MPSSGRGRQEQGQGGRIKRLRGLTRPQYRLRIDEMRAFYDATEPAVEILTIVTKAEAQACLDQVRNPGFGWFDYRLEHHPAFLRRITEARSALRRGLGVRLEDIED